MAMSDMSQVVTLLDVKQWVTLKQRLCCCAICSLHHNPSIFAQIYPISRAAAAPASEREVPPPIAPTHLRLDVANGNRGPLWRRRRRRLFENLLGLSKLDLQLEKTSAECPLALAVTRCADHIKPIGANGAAAATTMPLERSLATGTTAPARLAHTATSNMAVIVPEAPSGPWRRVATTAGDLAA